jgi:hypothetical protein
MEGNPARRGPGNWGKIKKIAVERIVKLVMICDFAVHRKY